MTQISDLALLSEKCHLFLSDPHTVLDFINVSGLTNCLLGFFSAEVLFLISLGVKLRLRRLR